MLKRRKLIVKLLLLTMCTSMLLTTTSFAEITGTINNQLTNSAATSESDFTFDASTGTIVKYIGTNSTVVIPSTINGVPVKIIGDDAFLDNIHITSVEIPSGVIEIGWYSFYRCYELTKLIIPDTVTSIDSGKSVCTGDKTLFYVASENVKQILMNNCFIEERKIRVNGQLPITFRFDANTGTITKYNGVDTAVVIPSTLDGISVKIIGDKAFENNDDIISVEIPNGVTSIGERAFSMCQNLKSITIPNSVTNIGDAAFQICSKLNTFYVESEATKQLLINYGIDESKIVLNGQVYTIKVSSIVINATNINLTVGQTETFTATVLPSNAANKGLTWKSSNELVATVDSTGKVTGVGSGSATITCTASDGSGVVSNMGITVSAQTNLNSGLKSVSITGTEEVSHKLKAKISYDGTQPSLTYQWQRASRIDGEFQDIDGAYDNEYKLKSIDKNKYIKLVVTEVINGRIFTLEDMTGRIKAHSSSNNEEDDNTSSNSSSNSSNNVVLRPKTNTSSSLNSQSPANGRFRNPSGGKFTGWIDTADGKWYYLDQNGDVVTGWVQFNDRWYYLNPNNDAKRGVMMTGWIRDNGNWYYLYSNGQMAGGTTIDGYTLDYTGKMIE